MGKYRKCQKIWDRETSLSDITNRFNNSENINVCKKTMWRFIRIKGYCQCLCRKKIRISEVNRKKRVTWCKEKRRWPFDDWKKVIFSDESQIVIGNDNQVYIWRKSNETFRPERICQGVNRKISGIIWGCITYNGVGALTEVDATINAAKRIEILNSCLWPVIAKHFPDDNYCFQDDNAPVHRARLTKTFTDENKIKAMEWPAKSPD